MKQNINYIQKDLLTSQRCTKSFFLHTLQTCNIKQSKIMI